MLRTFVRDSELQMSANGVYVDFVEWGEKKMHERRDAGPLLIPSFHLTAVTHHLRNFFLSASPLYPLDCVLA